MEKEEFEKLSEIKKSEDLITVKDLVNKQDRTLLYGYTCSRETFHVYLKNLEIHTIIYQMDYLTHKPINMREILVEDNYKYIPDKRLYPETCDYEFLKLLKANGEYLPFTFFNEDREVSDFYGCTLEDGKDY